MMKPIAFGAFVLSWSLLGCSPSVVPIDPGTPAELPVAPAVSNGPGETQARPSHGLTPQAPCVSSKDIRLELLAEQLPSGEVRIGLHNVGTVPACVLTHIATHEWQHDWLEIQVVQGKETRSLVFNDDRDKSAAVVATIPPGQTDWQEVDVIAWARRSRNGGVPLSKGEHPAHAIYDSSSETGAWAGKLDASFRLRVR